MQKHHKIYCRYLSQRWLEFKHKKEELQKVKSGRIFLKRVNHCMMIVCLLGYLWKINTAVNVISMK